MTNLSVQPHHTAHDWARSLLLKEFIASLKNIIHIFQVNKIEFRVYVV